MNRLESSNITLITKVTHEKGEVGYALVCDFGTSVDSSELSKSSFIVETIIGDEIEPRTIRKIYTSDSISALNSNKDGRYVVIELDIRDDNATTLSFDGQKFLNSRNKLKYALTQKIDIVTSNKVIFKASNNRVFNGKEISPIIKDFKKLTYTNDHGDILNYRLFEPETEQEKKYPLILFLHGSGERGNDNEVQIIGNAGAVVWAEPEVQVKNPCYILAPQAQSDDKLNAYWVTEPNYSMVLNLVKESIEKYPIDPNRIYVTGMSNGGVGTWNIVKKNPDLFSAAVPICGASNVTEEDAGKEFAPPLYYPINTDDVEILKRVPIWAFTAEDDPLVDPRNSREIVAAIEAAGGKLIHYTEYPAELKISHGSWGPAYQNKKMIEWLFSQNKQLQ